MGSPGHRRGLGVTSRPWQAEPTPAPLTASRVNTTETVVFPEGGCSFLRAFGALLAALSPWVPFSTCGPLLDSFQKEKERKFLCYCFNFILAPPIHKSGPVHHFFVFLISYIIF